MAEKKRDYVKISFQDIEIAENFFQNEKHFNEFFVAVLSYYREKPVNIKSKIVQKYFETYKKTMDFVIKSVKLGYEGQMKKVENETNKNHTLEGVVAVPLKASLEPNIKVISNNIKDKKEKEKEEWSNDHPLKNHIILNYPTILKLKPITTEECEKLLKTNTKKEIDDVLQAMENYKGLEKKYKVAYLTISTWLKRRKETPLVSKTPQNPINQQFHPDEYKQQK